MAGMKIGTLAQRAGTNAPTIRYYEEIGLLPKAERHDGGQRTYSDQDVRKLIFIRRCRDFGFPLEQVRTLATLVADPQRSCLEARDVAQKHLAAVRAKLKEMKALEKNIAAFVEICTSNCEGTAGSECVVLSELGEPEKRSAVSPRH